MNPIDKFRPETPRTKKIWWPFAGPQGKDLLLLNLKHEAKTCAGVSERSDSNPFGDINAAHVEHP